MGQYIGFHKVYHIFLFFGSLVCEFSFFLFLAIFLYFSVSDNTEYGNEYGIISFNCVESNMKELGTCDSSRRMQHHGELILLHIPLPLYCHFGKQKG